MTLNQVALEIGGRRCRIFLPDDAGRRPLYANQPLTQCAPVFAEHPLFFEYFDGDSGAGLGASHQTGWTGLIAKILNQLASGRARDVV